jgi:peptide/nickel transport system substrate-binding protein
MVTRRVHWQAGLAVLGILFALSALVRLVQIRDTAGQVPTSVPTNLPMPSVTPLPTAAPTVTPVTPSPTPTSQPTATPSPTASARPPEPIALPPTRSCHVEAVVGQPQYINPTLAQHDVDRDLVALIFSGLTKVDEHFEIVPDLAQRWRISPDGLTYTFDLRRDVVWHDGTDFTADDVIFTVQSLQQQHYQGPAQLAQLWETVRVEKVHRYSVRFILKEPFSPFLDYTTIGILPTHLLSDVPAALLPQQPYNLNPVGTGPFEVSQVHLDRGYLVLRANSAYFGAIPNLRQMEFQFYPSRTAIMAAYDQRAVTGIGGLLPQELSEVSEHPSLALHSAPVSRETFIFFNLLHPLAPFLAERPLRQALLLSLDRQALIDEVLDGQGIVADNVVFPGTWAHDPDARHYPYDPEDAAALLDEAGWVLPGTGQASGSAAAADKWRQRQGTPLAFSLLVDGANGAHTRLAEEIARQWAQVGVEVRVEPGLSHESLQLGRFTAALVECELPPDPDPYPIWHSTQATAKGQNYTRFSNRAADELMEEGRRVSDVDQRRGLYGEFQEVWAEELPALPLYHPIYHYALDTGIEGAQLGPMLNPSDRFRAIADWSMACDAVP